MTGKTTLVEPSDTRTSLLVAGVGKTEAAPPPTRLEEGFEERAAAYLEAHPEISAAVPSWAEEIDFSTIEEECDGTIFSFSKSIGQVELYGVGKVLPDGRVHLVDGGAPNIYLPGETECQKVGDVSQWMLDVAQNLIAAATLLRSEPKLLRRSAEVDAELQRLDA